MTKQFLLYKTFPFEPKPSSSWCDDGLNDDTPLAAVLSSLKWEDEYLH